jgi:hypothetical protein
MQQLLDRHGGSDRDIAAILNVDPSTVWRLRHKKIAKVSKYIQALSDKIGAPVLGVDRTALEDLVELAEQSPALRALLLALRNFLQEDAQATKA